MSQTSGLGMNLDDIKQLIEKAEKLNIRYEKQKTRVRAAVRRYYAKNIDEERARRKAYYHDVVKPRREAEKLAKELAEKQSEANE
jgi:hypothetical protein